MEINLLNQCEFRVHTLVGVYLDHGAFGNDTEIIIDIAETNVHI